MPGGSGTNCRTQAGVGGIYHILKNTKYTGTNCGGPLPQTANDLQCKLCTKKINQNDMRGHVACHILTEDLVGHCGYCGRGGSCTSVLKKTTRKMGKQYYKVESNC